MHKPIAPEGIEMSIAAVAFAQMDEGRQPLPVAAQPARADYACYAASFIGFATLLRRSAALGAVEPS